MAPGEDQLRRRRRVVAPPGARPGGPSGPRTGQVPTGPELERRAGERRALPDRRSARSAAAAGNHRAGDAPEPAEALTPERLLQPREDLPEPGWRELVHRLSFGTIRPKPSEAAVMRRELEERVARRLSGEARFVPVLTRKGGTGKTTVTTLLGMTMATLRDDRVIAVDANPDRGTLAERVPDRTPHTVRDVVQRAGTIQTFNDMSRLVTRDVSRLDVLASDQDPATAEAFGERDYRIVAGVVARHYSVVLTDCGTGMVHSVMRGTLDLADTIVLVSGTSVDEARLASETLTWLEARGYDHLVRSSVVALNTAKPRAAALEVEEVRNHFKSRCRAVIQVPYDPHLAEGAAIDLARVKPQTRLAALQLAAAVVDGLGPGRA